MSMNLTSFRMFLASCTGNAKNTIYSIPFDVSSAEDLEAACRKDHVCSEFQDNRRGSDNFIRCHAVMADCDNDNTDDPAAWITPDNIAERLPGIAFYAVKSRNCDKVKHPGEPGEKSARPRWHYYFPLRQAIPDINIIRRIMALLLVVFPEFDRDGMKPAQFFFGHAEPVAEYYPGEIDIKEYFRENPIDMEPEQAAAPAPAAAPIAAPGSDEEDLLLVNLPDMLEYFNADDYHDWVLVGICLKTSGYDFTLWDQWAQSSYKYPGSAESWHKWERGFKDGGKSTLGTLFHEAKKRGWQQKHFTGKYKANHEAAEAYKENLRVYREEHREEHRAALAAIGIETDDPYRYTWTYDFDGAFETVTDKETGEIKYTHMERRIVDG